MGNHQKGTTGAGILPHLHEETMRPDRMRIRTDGTGRAGKHTFRREGTACDMRKAMPVGNGDFGATVHGMPDNYFIRIGKNDLWWDDYPDAKTYVDYGIDGIREKLKNGDVTLNGDVHTASARRDHRPIQTCAAGLTLHLLTGTLFYNVREELDMTQGRASMRFSASDCNGDFCDDYAINTITSRTDDILCTWVDTGHSRAKSAGVVRMELTRPLFEPYNETAANPAALHEAQIAELDKYYQPEPFVDGNYWGFTIRLRRGHHPETDPDFRYTVMMTTTSDKFQAVPVFHSVIIEGRPVGSFSIFVTVVSSYDAEDTVAEAKRRLTRVMSPGLNAMMFDNSIGWWKYFWNRSWIKLPAEEYERPWYWGLYDAASARRPGKCPPGYLSPWHSENYVCWGYHILTYEQTKANLGLCSTNHSDLLEPWFALLHRAREKVRAFTEDFYRMPGTCYPHAISNEGHVISSVPRLNSTVMNTFTTGEALKAVVEYYDFTQDTDYLREVAYPLLRDAALFYDAYLLEEDNRKVIFPSRSQEYHGESHILDNFMKNSVDDVAQFRFVLTRAADAAEILGTDEDLRETWRTSAKSLGDYATYPDGSWKPSEDWEDQTVDYGCAAVSDLAPIVYTDEVDAWHGKNAAQIEAGRKTIRRITQNAPIRDGAINEDIVGWDESFGMLAKLRYGDREAAAKILPALPELIAAGNLDGWKNGTSFYVDKGAAYLSEVITEMLLQSQSGAIRVFPAYPYEFGDAAFYSLRAKGAFLVSAELREGKTAYILLKSLCGNPCRIANEFGENVRVRDLETDEAVEFTLTADGILEFQTVTGHEYVLENAAFPLESFPYIKA